MLRRVEKVEANLNNLAAPPTYGVTLRQVVQYDPPTPDGDPDPLMPLPPELQGTVWRSPGTLMETLPGVEYKNVENPQQFVEQLAVRQVERKQLATVATEWSADGFRRRNEVLFRLPADQSAIFHD